MTQSDRIEQKLDRLESEIRELKSLLEPEVKKPKKDLAQLAEKNITKYLNRKARIK
jgi:hypothetical protein